VTTPETEALYDRLDRHEEQSNTQMQALCDKMDKLSTMIHVHTAAEAVKMGTLADIKAAVFGNGTPGFKVRVDRLEQVACRIKWALTSVLVPLVLYAGYQLIHQAFAQ